MLTELDLRLAADAAKQQGVFTKHDARKAGFSEAQIGRRVVALWQPVHEGVYRMPGSPPTWRGDLLAACFAAASPVAVSHRSAAALYGLPGGRDDIVEITCRRWRRTQKPNLVVHESTRFGESDITVVDGVPVTIPERVVIELAGLKPYPNYIEAVFHSARRKRLIKYESMNATFIRLARRGVPGIAAVRVALGRWNPESRPSESDMETLLLQALRAQGLPEPVLQHEIRDERGVFIARVDAAYPDELVAIEYDSRQEHSDEFQIARDARRRNDVIAAGWRPLAARHQDLRLGGDVLAAQIRRIRRRSA